MHQNLDENLLNALRKGCRKAHNEVYRLYAVHVQMQAFYILNDRNDAEDVVQEVFKSLFEKGEALEIEKSLKNYLLMSAKYIALDMQKTRAHHKKYIHHTAYIQPKMELPGKQLENRDFNKNVQLGLEKIRSPLIRDAFKLYHLEDMDHKDVAELLGISVYYSRTSVNRAMNSLRDFLKNSD